MKTNIFAKLHTIAPLILIILPAGSQLLSPRYKHLHYAYYYCTTNLNNTPRWTYETQLFSPR